MNAFGHFYRGQIERFAERLQRAFGGLRIQCRAAAEEVSWIQEAKHHACVGHRRRLTAATVAGGARLRACALRADLSQAAG